jgi:hypothetical protein
MELPADIWQYDTQNNRRRNAPRTRAGPAVDYGPNKKNNEFKTLATETLNLITETGIATVANYASDIKTALRNRPNAQPF